MSHALSEVSTLKSSLRENREAFFMLKKEVNRKDDLMLPNDIRPSVL